MTADTLVERVRKLLALAESPNEHEAALAAEKAQELMLRHGISMAQVAASDGKTTIGVGEARVTGKLDPWRRDLAAEVAWSMGGRIVWRHDYNRSSGHLWFMGPAGTPEAMVELYRYLEGTLVTLSAVAAANRVETLVHGRTFRTSWLAGAVLRLGNRLRERRRTVADEGDNSRALVVVGDAVKRYEEERFGKTRTEYSRSGWTDPAAARAGFDAAANVPLGDPAIGRQQSQLGCAR